MKNLEVINCVTLFAKSSNACCFPTTLHEKNHKDNTCMIRKHNLDQKHFACDVKQLEFYSCHKCDNIFLNNNFKSTYYSKWLNYFTSGNGLHFWVDRDNFLKLMFSQKFTVMNNMWIQKQWLILKNTVIVLASQCELERAILEKSLSTK